MKIIILGAGHAGGSLAEILAGEGNSITLVDENNRVLNEYASRADLRTVCGKPSHPDVLEQADAGNTDMLIALANSDEINIAACQIASTLFNVPKKIARLREPSYHQHPDLFRRDAIPIDLLLSPEQLVSQTIFRLIQHPGALQVREFIEGSMLLVALVARPGSTLTGHPLRTLSRQQSDLNMRVAMIYRNNRIVRLNGDTCIEPNDEVFFLVTKERVHAARAALGYSRQSCRSVLIAGGGHIGMHLATLLKDQCQVKIIEPNRTRAETLSRELDHVLVLHGDATDEELIRQENIDKTDVFCALTSDDEDNIMSAMLAKHLGAHKVMSLISRPSYVKLIEKSNIDVAISPQQDLISAILHHIRRADVVKAYSLRRGAAEAIEAVVHGNEKTSRVVGRTLAEIKLPEGAAISAVVRNGQALPVSAGTRIEGGDHVILFVHDRRHIPKIEKLFQVGATFF